MVRCEQKAKVDQKISKVIETKGENKMAFKKSIMMGLAMSTGLTIGMVTAAQAADIELVPYVTGLN